MIFISYNHNDSKVAKIIAQRMAIVFGEQNIFFDEWSIKPGDGIIDKMNEALEKATYFFFIMSRNSLNSEMVKLEWQNALYLKSKMRLNFISVKLDDCNVPAILMQNLYIDINGKGLDVGLRQMIQVANGGKSSILDGGEGYQNIRGEFTTSEDGKTIDMNIYAKTIFEPNANFLIIHGNKNDDIDANPEERMIFTYGKQENIKSEDGSAHNGLVIKIDKGISPGFPLRLKIVCKEIIDFHGVLRETSENVWASIPIEKK